MILLVEIIFEIIIEVQRQIGDNNVEDEKEIEIVIREVVDKREGVDFEFVDCEEIC